MLYQILIPVCFDGGAYNIAEKLEKLICTFKCRPECDG
jgi:hypothetical protein